MWQTEQTGEKSGTRVNENNEVSSYDENIQAIQKKWSIKKELEFEA